MILNEKEKVLISKACWGRLAYLDLSVVLRFWLFYSRMVRIGRICPCTPALPASPLNIGWGLGLMFNEPLVRVIGLIALLLILLESKNRAEVPATNALALIASTAFTKIALGDVSVTPK